MDEDLQNLTREELIEEVKKLRQAIRKHRDFFVFIFIFLGD